MIKDAFIQGDYRYSLGRYWQKGKRRVLFIGLNPSTADAYEDDATIRRLVRFSRDWGFGGFKIVNLFAYRSTDPLVLKKVDSPVGPINDDILRCAIEQHMVIVPMWGARGGILGRDKEVIRLLTENMCEFYRVACFGTTKSGQPKHPLYLPADTELKDFL